MCNNRKKSRIYLMGAIPPCMAGVYIYAEVKFSKYTFDLEEAKNSPKSWTIHK